MSHVRLAADLPLADHLRLAPVQRDTENVAGVEVPVLARVGFTRTAPDLHATEPFFDDAIEALERLLRLRLEREVLEARRERLARELRTTSQRVNLFEKVKIPEAESAIRTIRIALGDMQAAEVVRAKIAKAVDAIFDLRPAAIIRDLDLRRPVYARTAAYGHFGRSDQGFTWEQTPRVDDLRRELSLP